MKKKRSIEEEQPKTVCLLGVLAVLVGATLFVSHPEAGSLQKIASLSEVTIINYSGILLMFVGFYFALVVLPTPKTKK